MANPLHLLAGPMGLEPTPSGLTGRRYNQLNYDPEIKSCSICYGNPKPPAVIRNGPPSGFHNFLVGGTGLEPVTSTV